jgi:hypothetical protein
VDEVALYSAAPRDYLTTVSRVHFHWWSHRFYDANDALFPGVVALALACVAFAGGRAWRNARARMLLAIGLAGFVLSFGPAVPAYRWLYEHLPLLQGIRGAARFGYLVLFAVAGLAAFGLAALRRWQATRRPGCWPRHWRVSPPSTWRRSLRRSAYPLRRIPPITPCSERRRRGCRSALPTPARSPGTPRGPGLHRPLAAPRQRLQRARTGYAARSAVDVPPADALDELRQLGVTHVVVRLTPCRSSRTATRPEFVTVASARRSASTAFGSRSDEGFGPSGQPSGWRGGLLEGRRLAS